MKKKLAALGAAAAFVAGVLGYTVLSGPTVTLEIPESAVPMGAIPSACFDPFMPDSMVVIHEDENGSWRSFVSMKGEYLIVMKFDNQDEFLGAAAKIDGKEVHFDSFDELKAAVPDPCALLDGTSKPSA